MTAYLRRRRDNRGLFNRSASRLARIGIAMAAFAALVAVAFGAVAMAGGDRATATGPHAAPAIQPSPVPTCSDVADTWAGGASGAWETAGNWSGGVPGASDEVCIPSSDSVTVNSTDTVASLLLGSGASLDIQTGGLTFAGGDTVDDSALQGSLTVASGASLTVGPSGTLLNASGGSIVDHGTVAVAGSFEQDAGTVATGSGDNPVQLANGSSLAFAGSGAGAFQVSDPSTDTIGVSLSGDLASGQSLDMPAQDLGIGDETTTVTAAASFTNAGTITIDHTGGGIASSAELVVPGTLTNTGTIKVSGSPDAGSASDRNETFSGDLDNEGTLDVGISGNPGAYLIFPAGSQLTNTGTIDIAGAAASSNSEASTLTIAAATNGSGGSIVDDGTVAVQGTFSQGAGTVSGTDPVQLGNGSSLAFTGAGAGAFQVADPTTDAIGVTLSGDLAAGQSLDMPAQDIGAGPGVTTVTAAASFTNAGTITIDHSGNDNESGAALVLPSGDTLTNTGTIAVSGSPAGSNQNQYNETFTGDLDNKGTLDVGISGNPAAYLIFAAGSQLTNTGTIDIAADNTLAIAAATTGAHAQPAAAATNGSGGSIVNEGTFAVAGSFTQGAGTVATASGDNPVQLWNGSSLAFSGTGAGAFQVADPSTDTIAVSLTGNLASGQSLDMPAQDIGAGPGVTTVTAAASFTNAGTITIDHSGNDKESGAALVLPSGDTLTNTGTIAVSGSPAGSNQNQYNETFTGNLDNQGALEVGIDGNPAAYFTLPSGSDLTNTGTIDVTAGNTLATAGTDSNGAGGSIVDQGTFAVAGSFTQGAGTVATASGDNPVQLWNGSSLAFSGTGAGAFQVADPSTDTIAVSLTGNLASGQSLDMPAQDIGAGPGVTTVTAAASFTNAGTITIDHSGNDKESGAALVVPSGDTLTNTGTIAVSGSPAGSNQNQYNETFTGNLDNQGALEVGIGGNPAAYFTLPSGSDLTNTGTIDVSAGNTLATAGTVTAKGGTIVPDGTFASSGTFVQGGGDTTGSGSVQIAGGGLDITGTGAASLLVPGGSQATLSGNVAADQTVAIDNHNAVCGGTLLTARAGFTNAGTIALDSDSCSSGPAELNAGGAISNDGTIAFAPGDGASAEISAPLVNDAGATISVTGGGTATIDGALSNDGLVQVDAGSLSLAGGLTNLSAGGDLSGGSYAVLGSSNATATLDLPGSAPEIATLDAELEVGAGASFGEAPAISEIGVDGALTLDQGATATVTATTLENAGTLTLSPGVRLLPTYFTQVTTGTLDEEIDGTVDSGQYGELSALGAANIAGKLAIQQGSGFTPTSGAVYAPVQGESLSGTFAAVTGTAAGSGLAYSVGYTGTAVELTAGPGVDLAASAVTGSTSVTPGQQATVSWTATAVGRAVSGSWTDAVYLSPSTTLSANAVLVGTQLHSGGLADGASYTGSLSDITVPGVLPGTWHYVVLLDAGDVTGNIDAAGGSAASGAVTVSMTQLAVGGSVTGTIPAGGDVYVELAPAAGSTVQLTATFAGGAATGIMYESYGTVPGPSSADTPQDGNAAVQTATIGSAQPGGYYVDLDNPTSVSQGFSLGAVQLNAAITAVTPSTGEYSVDIAYEGLDNLVEGSGSGDIDTEIDGAGFTPQSTASLTCSYPGEQSTTAAASTVRFIDSTRLQVDFGAVPLPEGIVLPLPTGSCDVQVDTGSSVATAQNAIALAGRVVNTSDPNYLDDTQDPTPELTIQAPAVNRPGVDAYAQVSYRNPYSFPIPAALVQLSATGATLHYPGAPGGQSTSLLLLTTAPSGDPAVLQPGQEGTAEVAFDSSLGAHQTVQFSVDTTDPFFPVNGTIANGQSFNLGQFLAQLLPSGVDPSVASYLSSRFSSAGDSGEPGTVADWQAALDSEAEYLWSIGQPATDTGQLLEYELAQATNYGATVQDHTDGSLGYGLPGVVATLTSDQDGDVTVNLPSGSTIQFVARPDGSYGAAAGANASLEALSAGGWTLSDTDGDSDTFNAGGQLTSSADGYGTTTTYQYDSDGDLTSEDEPDGTTLTLTHDGENHITSIANSATGQTTTYTYDSTGRLTSVTDASGTTQLGWNESADNEAIDGTLSSITQPDGIVDGYAYNSDGQLTAIARNGTTETSLSYPSAGTVEVSDANGNTTTAQLDASGGVVRAVLPDGTIDATTFDPATLVGTVTLGESSIEAGFDTSGDLTSLTDPLGDQTSESYAAPGALSKIVEPNGLQWQAQTNPEGDVTQLTDPAGNDTVVSYTPSGQVQSFTDQSGETTTYGYDGSGQLDSIKLPTGEIDAYQYDQAGNLISASNASGTTALSYNTEGEVTSVAYPTGLGIAYTYDSSGRVSSETTSDGYQENYHYNDLDQLESLTDASGKTIVSYGYDADGRPTTITDGNGAATDYTYDADGNVASVTDLAADGSAIASYQYARNSLGEITAISGSQGTSAYTYDADGQLTGDTLPGGESQSYSYDSAGNRTATTDSASGSQAYALGADDEYAKVGETSYTYDQDGNLTSATDGSGTTTYTWTAAGQLASADGPAGDASYSYDALGDVISEQDNGTTTEVLTDPTTGAELGSYSGAGAALEHYPYGLGVIGQADASGQTSYYGFDASGNVTTLTDASGAASATYRYLPFGGLAGTPSGSAPLFGYEGQFGIATDPVTGFTHNGVRSYDPAIGRFISQDPDVTSATNPYEYAGNDPLDETDLTGFSTTDAQLYFETTNREDAQAQLSEYDRTNNQFTTSSLALSMAQAAALATGQVELEPVLNRAGAATAAAQAAYQASHGHQADATVTAATGALGFKLPTPPSAVLNAWLNITNTGQALTNGVSNVVSKVGNGAVSLVNGISNAIPPAPPWMMDPQHQLPGAMLNPGPTGGSESTTSDDPNDISGPSGYGSAGFIQGGTPLPYEIQFANLPSASAPAAAVTVSEQLDPSLDLSTFSLGAFGFAGHVVTPPPGLRSYQTTIDDTAVSGLDVTVTAKLDSATRTVSWTFQSIDPATGLPPTDAAAGFLPADQTAPEGEGWVSYTVTPESSAATGTQISAAATVRFDANASMTTSTLTNTIDAGAPTASVAQLPDTEDGPFTVSWGGSDDQGGSGIASYDVAYSEDGGAWVPLETDTTATSTSFTGEAGHSYAFVAWATDNVGNVQAIPTQAQTQTQVVAPSSGSGGGDNGGGGQTTTTGGGQTGSGGSQTTTGGNQTETTTTTHQTAKPKPRVRLLGSAKPKIAGSKVPLKLGCSAAPCSGKATLTVAKTVTIHKGKKTIHKHETLTYGEASYTARTGKTITVTITLTKAGTTALEQAGKKTVEVTETITVKGGRTVTRALRLHRVPSAKAAGKKK